MWGQSDSGIITPKVDSLRHPDVNYSKPEPVIVIVKFTIENKKISRINHVSGDSVFAEVALKNIEEWKPHVYSREEFKIEYHFILKNPEKSWVTIQPKKGLPNRIHQFFWPSPPKWTEKCVSDDLFLRYEENMPRWKVIKTPHEFYYVEVKIFGEKKCP